MQYLLTEEEYANLQPIEVGKKAEEAVKYIREMLIGDNCVHSGKPGNWHYCDVCPLSHIGGNRKEDIRPDYKISKVLCNLSREYSQ